MENQSKYIVKPSEEQLIILSQQTFQLFQNEKQEGYLFNLTIDQTYSHRISHTIEYKGVHQAVCYGCLYADIASVCTFKWKLLLSTSTEQVKETDRDGIWV